MQKRLIITGAVVVAALLGCWRVVEGDLGRRPMIVLVPTAAPAPFVVSPAAVPEEARELLRTQALQSDVILWGD